MRVCPAGKRRSHATNQVLGRTHHIEVLIRVAAMPLSDSKLAKHGVVEDRVLDLKSRHIFGSNADQRGPDGSQGQTCNRAQCQTQPSGGLDLAAWFEASTGHIHF